jgi:hypothetical protein
MKPYPSTKITYSVEMIRYYNFDHYGKWFANARKARVRR